MYKLCFYVPESDLELVKRALFDAGAGKIGHYDHCAWQTLGTGQFRPLPGSNPHLGSQNEIETTAEYQVEMVCEKQHLAAVIEALHEAHPYETPAFSFWEVLTAPAEIKALSTKP